MAEGDQQVALAGARRSDQTEVLRGPDPLETREVVEASLVAPTRLAHVELLEGLGDRESAAVEPSGRVARVARGDLGFEQRAQELLGTPALGLGGDQQLRREVTNRRESKTSQSGVEVGRQCAAGSCSRRRSPIA